MPGIYLYWEGENRHWYYDLCYRTILRHNPEAKLLGRADVESVIGPIPSELDAVYVIHRVDWIRKKYIEAVGGLWIDMDFACWRPLNDMIGMLAFWDFIGYREWPGNWMDNFFSARKGCPVLRSAAEFALNQVKEFGKDVTWLSTNANAIERGMSEHGWGYNLCLPTHIISPVSVMDPQWFCSDMGEHETLDNFRCYGFITSFHGIGDWLKQRTEQEFLSGNSRLSAIVRKALA